MNYISIAEGRKLSGLRLVLTAHSGPGPWGEAAKALLRLRKVNFTPVAQAGMEPNEDLVAWTGVRNAPVAILDDEPPMSSWLEILLLAERLGSGPSLLPSDPLERALVIGLSAEICGPEGFGWSRRVAMMGGAGASQPSAPPPPAHIGRIMQGYGIRAGATERANDRSISILKGLAAQLRRQQAAGSEYLVTDRLTACDIHWACFSQLVGPLPESDCPMGERMRALYNIIAPEIAAAVGPALMRHRDMIFRKYIGLPLDF